MTVNSNAATLTPQGFGVALLAFSIFFSISTTIVVALRCWVRLTNRFFGVDDGFMVAGWILFLCYTGCLCPGLFVGVGVRDDGLNENLQRRGRMYIYLVQLFYCASVLCIKTAIAVTLLRLATERIYRIIIWIVLIISVLSSLAVIVGLLGKCRPLPANWDPSKGTCWPPIVLTSLSYLISASSVATDWVCAILPMFMLYHVRMQRATKISVNIVLGLGVLASISTIVRIPYLTAYNRDKDFLYDIGLAAFWTIFECGIGIIAGSLPSLRRLLLNWIRFDRLALSSRLRRRNTVASEVNDPPGPFDEPLQSSGRYLCGVVEFNGLENREANGSTMPRNAPPL